MDGRETAVRGGSLLIWISLGRYLNWRRPRPDLDVDVLASHLLRRVTSPASFSASFFTSQPWRTDRSMLGLSNVEIDRIEIGFALDHGIVPRGVVYLTFSQYDDSEPQPDRSVSRDGQADNGIIADG